MSRHNNDRKYGGGGVGGGRDGGAGGGGRDGGAGGGGRDGGAGGGGREERDMKNVNVKRNDDRRRSGRDEDERYEYTNFYWFYCSQELCDR